MDSMIGHNRPPSYAELAKEEFDRTAKSYEERRDEIVKKCNALVIRDQEDVGAVGDMGRIIKALADKVAGKAKDIAEPYQETVDALRAASQNFTEPLWEARDTITQKVEDFRAAERAKAKAAQQEQYEAEKRQAAARAEETGVEAHVPKPAPQPKKSAPARGDLGGRVSERNTLNIEIEDVRALPDFVLNADKVKEALISTVRSMVQAGAEVPGVKVDRGVKTTLS